MCRDIDDVKEEVNTGEKAEGIYEVRPHFV